jgi:hypothetical protein
MFMLKAIQQLVPNIQIPLASETKQTKMWIQQQAAQEQQQLLNNKIATNNLSKVQQVKYASRCEQRQNNLKKKPFLQEPQQ